MHWQDLCKAVMTFLFCFVLLRRPANVCLTTLQDLLHAKADANIADNVGRTALSWAVTNKNGMEPFAD